MQVIFVDNKQITDINKTYRNIDKPTDYFISKCEKKMI